MGHGPAGGRKRLSGARLLALALAGAAALVTPSIAQDAAELAVARETLERLQSASFRKRKEYCGFIGYLADGTLTATRALEGTHDGCNMDLPDNMAVVASYHTHGGFDEDYFGEIPSDIDIEGDAELRINGYVATPGGRLWFVDTVLMEVRQVCGIGCLAMAPGFYKGTNGTIAERYSYEALLEKLRE